MSCAIAAFFYVRVIVLMFFTDPKPDGPTVAVPSLLTATAIGLGVLVTLVLGIAAAALPGPGGQGRDLRPLTQRSRPRPGRRPHGGRGAVLPAGAAPAGRCRWARTGVRLRPGGAGGP